jgi:uncharacterized protein (TIGR02145 family)
MKSTFAGLPGGGRDYDEGFYSIGADGNWWSSSESSADDAWCRNLGFNDGFVYTFSFDKPNGFSVRCLRD